MNNCVHVIDPDNRRRTRISHELNTKNWYVEPYHDVTKFSQRNPCDGYIFAADEPDGGNPPLVAEALQRCGTALPVIIYACYPVTDQVVLAMLSGASGYLEWPFRSHELDLTFQRLAADREHRVRLEQLRSAALGRVELLTQREKQVLALIAEGLKNKEVGSSLQISARTVEIHRGNMMRKLNVQSAAAAVRIALLAGLDESIHFAV